MNRKSLAVLIGLSFASLAVQAQDYDDRWYFAPWIGYYHNDSDRNTDEGSLYGSLGIGKFVAPNSSIDVFVDRTTRTREFPNQGSGWDNNAAGVSLRHHFGDADSLRPYIMGGIGMSHHDPAGSEKGWDPFVQAGVGIATPYNDNVTFRAELAYRVDMDDETIPSEDDYGDVMLNLGLAIAIGEAPDAPEPVAAEPEPAPVSGEPVPDCSALDDDRDGVNNCDDKCPATPSGQIVGPDGCPQEVVIDLRGVEFKFDRPTSSETDIGPALKEPSSEGIAVLDQAVDVLQRYPQVRVEVAGHTDSVGTDAYNQGLSERRSKIVYDYLTAKGVDGSRLQGPTGYGESRPIDTNDTKEGRQRNRRTELVIQR